MAITTTAFTAVTLTEHDAAHMLCEVCDCGFKAGGEALLAYRSGDAEDMDAVHHECAAQWLEENTSAEAC